MAKDVGDVIGSALGRVAREAAQSVSGNAKKASDGPLSGAKGLAAGAAVAALAPLAVKGAKLAGGRLAEPLQKAGGKVGEGVSNVGKGLLPGSGDGDSDDGDSDDGDSGGKNSMPGVGKGRRMPIQQAVDVAVPLKTAYNHWTQFEEWPTFMHRLDRVTQEDEGHVSFKTKIWGVSKEFTAEIIEQRPDELVKWRVTDGLTHTGVVSFHELSDRLTRIEVNVDIEPGSLIEKAGRGMRHAKRAIRADLARFKAYVEMADEETGAWRGVIEDGEVKSTKQPSSRQSSGEGKKTTSSGGARSKGSSSRGGSKSSSGGSKASSGGGKTSSSGARGRSSSSRGKGSSKAKTRSSGGSSRSSNGARASSKRGSSSSSSRKKSGSRS